MTTPKNPPAFPQHVAPAFPQEPGRDGMSLRDYFAGQAMIALHSRAVGMPLQHRPEDLAVDAGLFYRIADSMLAARQAQGGAE